MTSFVSSGTLNLIKNSISQLLCLFLWLCMEHGTCRKMEQHPVFRNPMVDKGTASLVGDFGVCALRSLSCVGIVGWMEGRKNIFY